MNTALPLLNLLHNSNYNGSPSLADNSFGRSYEYANGSDADSAQGQSNGYNPSYGYPYNDDLSTFGLSVHDQYGSRPNSSGQPPSNGGYPNLVGPDFTSHQQHAYRNDNGHHGQHSHHNGTANGDAARYLDLDLNQPGPSSYRHSSGDIYAQSEASQEGGATHSVVDSSRDDHDSKAANGSPEGAAPTEGAEADNEEPLYVNAKQYHRILKRRMARARLEELNRLVRSRKVSSLSTLFLSLLLTPSPTCTSPDTVTPARAPVARADASSRPTRSSSSRGKRPPSRTAARPVQTATRRAEACLARARAAVCPMARLLSHEQGTRGNGRNGCGRVGTRESRARECACSQAAEPRLQQGSPSQRSPGNDAASPITNATIPFPLFHRQSPPGMCVLLELGVCSRNCGGTGMLPNVLCSQRACVQQAGVLWCIPACGVEATPAAVAEEVLNGRIGRRLPIRADRPAVDHQLLLANGATAAPVSVTCRAFAPLLLARMPTCLPLPTLGLCASWLQRCSSRHTPPDLSACTDVGTCPHGHFAHIDTFPTADWPARAEHAPRARQPDNSRAAALGRPGLRSALRRWVGDNWHG